MSGIFPVNGASAGDTTNSVLSPTLAAGTTAAWYRSSCSQAVDRFALNALISEILNAVNAAGISYDGSRVNNLALALAAIEANAVSTTTVESMIAAAVAALVGSAPDNMNTLREISAALCNDPNFCTTVETRFSELIGTAPAGYQTLGDLFDAIGGDPNFASSVNAALAGKADNSITITGGGIATGGGDLTADRVITVTAATLAQIQAGTDDTVAITPAGLADYLAAVAASGGPLVFVQI